MRFFVLSCISALISVSDAQNAADTAWQHLQELNTKIGEKVPIGINAAEFYAVRAKMLHDAAVDFVKQFPNDLHEPEAMLWKIATTDFPESAELRMVSRWNKRANVLGLRFAIQPLLFASMSDGTPAIGVIGGSGLYQIDGLESIQEIVVDTPFGKPSDSLVYGYVDSRPVYFLPRHARGHKLLPTELNHRANIFALRSLNVRWIVSVGAVGSLDEKYAPRDIVLPSQFFDRTSRRSDWTFFGDGIVAHVGFADPTSANLRTIIAQEASELGYTVHNGGTYVNMDGPAFSTRAESEFHRKMGFDIIGMTNLPEAKLAREAEISLASMNFVTDYDCWKIEDEPVSAQTVIGHLLANAEAARRILPRVIRRIPPEPDWPEHRALDSALVTDRRLWPEVTIKKLETILERFS